MRSTQSPSIDFNQMLVVSVFFHFFVFTVFMFLPQTKEVVKHITPTFEVHFVDIPTGPAVPPAPSVEKTPVTPVPPAKPVVEKPIPQKPKPIAKPKTVPEPPAASNALVSKLDELAKKTAPKKDKLAMAVPKPKESVLENFEDIKMKTELEQKKKPTRKKIAKDDLALKELEFEHFSKKSSTRQSQDTPKKKSSLLKELEELEEINKQAHASLNKPKIKHTDSKANDLVKQLEAIKKENVEIKIDINKLTAQYTQQFKSEMRNVKITEFQKMAAASPASGESGDPAAKALNNYAGEVYVKVMRNWKDPVGGGNGGVKVSLTIFPKGNIAMPKILKSSGDSKLDNLAIRAIKNAVPFPPFPKEINEPNIPLILGFVYVPKN